MKYLLNQREREALRDYSDLYKKKFGEEAQVDPNLFVNLGDNPKHYLCWSATSGKIPTFRTNGGRIYNVRSNVWMCPRDKLAALGLPVTPATALAMGVPMLPVADDLRAASVAGNSFHFSTATVIQLIALACHQIRAEEA